MFSGQINLLKTFLVTTFISLISSPTTCFILRLKMHTFIEMSISTCIEEFLLHTQAPSQHFERTAVVVYIYTFKLVLPDIMWNMPVTTNLRYWCVYVLALIINSTAWTQSAGLIVSSGGSFWLVQGARWSCVSFLFVCLPDCQPTKCTWSALFIIHPHGPPPPCETHLFYSSHGLKVKCLE